MAPLSTYIVNTMYEEVSIQTRRLGNNNDTAKAPALTPSQENSLQILALTFATISVASAILAFYWFIKMRRSFRHESVYSYWGSSVEALLLMYCSLIMLLIQSDMFKALWFMVYPIVVFAHGPVPNDSKFCQVNGFFLSLGMEASGTGTRSTILWSRANSNCRFRYSHDRRSHRPVHIQTSVLRRRKRFISLPSHCIHSLGCVPCSYGFPSLHQQQRRVHIRWHILLSSGEAILVSTRAQLDPSLLNFHIYSGYIRIDILLRPI
jgi:hypothetical protein